MAEVVRVCGIAKERIASICNVSRINRIISIDFLVIVFGVVMSFLIPDEMEPSDGYIVVGDTVVSQDANTWIATKSLAHAEGKQLVSGVPEVVQVSGELENLSNVSVSGFDTTSPLEAGDVVVAEVGSSSVASVSGGGATTVETSEAGGSNSFGATFMNNKYPLPNGERIKALGLKSSSAQTGFLFVYRQDSATEYTCVARVELTHSGSGLLEYAELDTPYDVPSTGVFYVAGANFNTAGAYMYDTSALRANPVDAVVGETLTFAATTVAPVTGYQYGSMYAVTVNPPFSTTPTKVFKKSTGLALKLGAGATGEYLGPEVGLTLSQGENIIPVMDAQTTAGCTITASSFHNTYPAWNVGAGGGGWWIVDTSVITPSADLTISFISEQTASRLRLTAPSGGNTSAYQPRTIGIYLDGALEDTWLTGDWDAVNGETKEFSFSSTKRFSTLKLSCSNSLEGNYVGCNTIEILAPGLSTTSDLVFESSESIAEKIIKPDGPPVGGTGAALIPSFVGATYDEITDTATVDGWVIGQTECINQNYPAFKTRQNDNATVVPGYLPSWATGSSAGYAEITAPEPVAVGALVLAGGNPGGLNCTAPDQVVLYGFDGSSWIEVLNITENRWTSDWQEFRYPLSDIATYKEWRLWMNRDNVIHKIQFEEASSLTYTADPASQHNDIQMDGVRHKVSQVVEESDGTSYTTTATLVNPLPQAPTGTESVCIPSRLLDLECAISAEVVSEGLKLTGEKIIFEDNPDIKAMCMAVKAPAETVLRDFKISPERMG